MDQQTFIADVEARAKAASIPMYRVCEVAGVHPTTLSRWKFSEQNPKPVNASFTRLAALAEAVRVLTQPSESNAA